jgi:hypothetical protein
MMCLRKQWFVFSAVLVVLLFSAGLGVCDIGDKCADTANIDFGPGVHFTSATLVPAGGGLPEHCLVKGAFLPEEDPFVVKLPTNWNGNYFQVGNGGLAGSIDPASVNFGLVRGYAAASASGGYDVSNPINANGQFGYNPPDNSNPYAEEKLDGYCFSSVHKMNVLAKQIIKIYYGKRAHYSYYQGCSTGGRQGMIEAQRFPKDFDGIIAGAPLVYLTKVTMRDIWQAQNAVALPWIPPDTNAMMAIVADGVYKECDSTDGLVDGLIDDPRRCKFNVLTSLPACEDGLSPCFTSAQRTAIQKIYDGPRNSDGDLLFKGAPFGSEAVAPGFFGPASGWLGWIIPFVPGTLSIGGGMGSSFTQYCSLPPDRGGPGWNYMTFNWDDDWPYVMEKMSARCDANDPDLSKFKKQSGKLIQYHGWADPLVSPYAMAKYYDEVLAFMGERATDEFYKLYMIPGLYHCGGGLGCSNDVGIFDALVNWVENGVEPKEIIGSRSPFPPLGLTARTRPLCPYPEVARYLGAGSIDDAANFTCVKTIQAHVRIEPETLKLGSGGTFTAFVTLPHQGDWRVTSAVCEGAPAVKLTRHGHSYKATFNKQDLKSITVRDAVTFTVTLFAEQQGRHCGHSDKGEIAFEGSDIVRVVE